MQRYGLVGDYDVEMAPISDGDYVLYADVKEKIGSLLEALVKEMIRSERMRWMLVEPGYYTEEEMQRAGL